MLGLLNAVISKGSGLIQYVKEGLVMANRFLTPPSLSHPANGSAEFDGASDYIQLDTDVLTDFSAFTIGAWFYIDSAENGSIVSFGYTADDNKLLNFEIVSSNLLKFVYRPTGSFTLQSSALDGFIGKWNYYVVSVSGANQSLYYNGSEVVSTTSGATATPPVFDRVQIGMLGRSTNAAFYEGNLANVAIWNRALSSDEINSVMWKGYSQLNTSELNGLQAWYSLTESESLVGDDTATLEKYAQVKGLTFEGKTCLQNALNAFPDITDARLYSANYDIRVSADGGSIEALSCVETELNALLV